MMRLRKHCIFHAAEYTKDSEYTKDIDALLRAFDVFLHKSGGAETFRGDAFGEARDIRMGLGIRKGYPAGAACAAI